MLRASSSRVMDTQTFVIKSLVVQNSIMLIALGMVLCFLFYSLIKKKPKHLLASLIWLGIVLWFFNSPFFGFSTVSVNPEGIDVNYGILSLKNDRLPITSPWKIEVMPSGLRKMKKVCLIRIGDRKSMKVRRGKALDLLKEIGATIDEYRDLS